MPSSSGKPGRAKASREQPDRSDRTSASSPNAGSTGVAPPTPQNGGTDDDRPSVTRRGGTPRGKNQRKAQRAKRDGNPAATGQGQGGTRRGNRRRAVAKNASAQRSAAPRTSGQRTAGQRTSGQRTAGQRAAGQRTAGQRAGGPVRRRARRMRTVDETSAGGLVVDTATHRAALIGRLDRRGRLLWSLPKGHIESGETAEQAAVREVAEETGIESAVMATLGSIDYWFVADDRRVHKTVHHFLLRALGGELSDADVEVTAVAWVPLPDLQERLAYADERRLVRRAADLLAESA